MTRAGRLYFVLFLNLSLVVALVAVGITAHSVGVWAEGVDYLADAAGIGVALMALRLEGPTRRRPAGRPGATRYAALLNASWLLVLSLLVAADSALRLASGTGRVHGLPVMVSSAVAAVVMVVGTVVLGGDVDDGDDASLSVRAVALDTAGDAAAAGGVAIAGAVIFASGGLFWLDPAVALTVSVVVAGQALRLLRRLRPSAT